MEQIKQTTHERFLPQREFCREVGITESWARSLRFMGVLPSFGEKPVYIPLYAGAEAIAKYSQRKTS